MNKPPYISAATRAECEDLLTIALCQGYEARYRKWESFVVHCSEEEYECDPYECEKRPDFHQVEVDLFSARYNEEHRYDNEPGDYDPDGKYGWKTTGMRDGAMIW